MAKAKSSKNFLVLQNYLFWLIGVGKEKRILLLAKAKSSKSFCAPRARFWEFVESRVDSAESWNLAWILRVRILGFCGIAESLVDLSL